MKTTSVSFIEQEVFKVADEQYQLLVSTLITGARWRLDRAEAVLRIRALRASGDFEEYWQFHKIKEFKRNHVSKYQNPEILLAA